MSLSPNTLLLHIESGAYPLFIASLPSRHTNISFGTSLDAQGLEDLGYAIVETAERPFGDVVTEGAPALRGDGTYVQSFLARDFNAQEKADQLESARQVAASTIAQLQSEALQKGAPFDFGGDAGVQHVQMRDSDRPNILGLKARADDLAQKQVTDAVIPLRTFEDKTLVITPAQMASVAWGVLDAYYEVMSAVWALKDAVAAAKQASEMPEMPAAIEPSVRVAA